jgi:GNAT superfamily N-acetyltransferase
MGQTAILMNLIVRCPENEEEWEAYYQLRFDVLRKPWNQPEGSEKSDDEIQAIHGAVFFENKIIAVGRIHANSNDELQVRFMAVHPNFQGQGAGSMVLKYLEEKGKNTFPNSKNIFLQARANAVIFYERNGYRNTKSTFLLFDEIQHFLMEKMLG